MVTTSFSAVRKIPKEKKKIHAVKPAVSSIHGKTAESSSSFTFFFFLCQYIHMYAYEHVQTRTHTHKHAPDSH